MFTLNLREVDHHVLDKHAVETIIVFACGYAAREQETDFVEGNFGLVAIDDFHARKLVLRWQSPRWVTKLFIDCFFE